MVVAVVVGPVGALVVGLVVGPVLYWRLYWWWGKEGYGAGVWLTWWDGGWSIARRLPPCGCSECSPAAGGSSGGTGSSWHGISGVLVDSNCL